jgi:hypothetical protein
VHICICCCLGAAPWHRRRPATTAAHAAAVMKYTPLCCALLLLFSAPLACGTAAAATEQPFSGTTKPPQPQSSPPLPVRLRALGGLELIINPVLGAFDVLVDDRHWLRSAPPRYLPDVTLRLIPASSVTSSGSDVLGSYDSFSLDWGAAGKALLRTVFRAYHSASSGTPSQPRGEGSVAVDSGLITFTQIFLAGIANTSDHFNGSSVAPTGTCTRFGDRIPSGGEGGVRGGGDEGLGKPLPLPATTALALGSFPAFDLRAPQPNVLNWFAPQGNQLAATSFGRFDPLGFHAENGQNSMPLALFDASGRSIALTPLRHFFVAVHETVSDPHVLSIGPAASVESIPAGFECDAPRPLQCVCPAVVRATQ